MKIKNKKSVAYTAYNPNGKNGCYVNTGEDTYIIDAVFDSGCGAYQPLRITINSVVSMRDAVNFAMYKYCGMLYDVKRIS